MLFYKQTFTFERHIQLSHSLLIVSNFKTRAAVGFAQITHIKSTLALLSITSTQNCHNQSLLSSISIFKPRAASLRKDADVGLDPKLWKMVFKVPAVLSSMLSFV